jgi:hypothetical protein
MPTPRGKIPRINYVTVGRLNITDEAWGGIEDAYGRLISPQIRALIDAATNDFVNGASAENTGRMGDALNRARSLHKLAQHLIAAIDERPSGEVTREYVDDLIALHHAVQNATKFRKLLGIRVAPLAERKYVVELLQDLHQFKSACELTLQELDQASQYNYWPDGAAWEKWIRNLIDIVEANKLPAKARKDVDKNRSGKASPFVEFVCALQCHIPKEFVPKKSKDAFATAIGRARSKKRKTHLPKKKPLPARRKRGDN